MLLIIIGTGIIVVWSYILWGREFLVEHFPGGRIQWWHEEIEDKLWASSRTILAARGYQLAGALVALQGIAASAGVDVTPVVNELAKLVPEGYRGLALGLGMVFTGIAFEWLRRISSGAVGDKQEG
jgi:hypothetical protein